MDRLSFDLKKSDTEFFFFFLFCRPTFEEVDQLCEALLLHIEHGMAGPPLLQGSAVDFYHQARDSVYKDKAADKAAKGSPSAKRTASLCTTEEQKKLASEKEGQANS